MLHKIQICYSNDLKKIYEKRIPFLLVECEDKMWRCSIAKNKYRVHDSNI